MELAEIYRKGEAFFRDKDCDRLLEYVETGFIRENDRRVLDRFTRVIPRPRRIGSRSRTGRRRF